jgi:hypothetical protein
MLTLTRDSVEEHLREEFEDRLREHKPPNHITFERKLNGQYIEPMLQFLFCLFSQGAQAGARMAVEELMLKALDKAFKE